MLTVGSIMTREPVTLPPGCPLERALWLMRELRLRQVLVSEDGRLAGILSERDLWEPRWSRLGVRSRRERRVTELRDRMNVSLETVRPEESASLACRRMLERRVGCLPVVRDGRLAGALSEEDLARLYVRVCRSLGPGSQVDPLVRDCTGGEAVVVAPEETVARALELCRSRGIRHLPVVREGRLVGIASDRDLLPVVARGEGGIRRVGDVMTSDYVAVASESPLSGAAERMLREGFHSLPVLEQGVMAGIVTSTDVLRALSVIDEEALEAAWGETRAHGAPVEKS